MREFTPAKRHVEVSVGESVRILREFQELSQNELADIVEFRSRQFRRSKTTASVWAWRGPRRWRER